MGLHPFPRGRINFDKVIGQTVLARMRAIIDEHRDVRGARQLIGVVHRQLCEEYRLPTAEGRNQMRYVVAHWITAHMADDRGGVRVADDVQGVVNLAEGDVVQRIDASFSNHTETNPTTAAPSSQFSAMNDLNMAEVLRMPAESVSRAIDYLHAFRDVQFAIRDAQCAFGDTQTRMKERFEAEAALLREHRPRAPKRARVTENQTDDGPRFWRQRYSVSHAALDTLRRHHPDVSKEAVFDGVYRWFEARRGCVGKQPLDTIVTWIDNRPVVYAWPAGHTGAFAGSRYEEQLIDHLCGCLNINVIQREGEITDTDTVTTERAPLEEALVERGAPPPAPVFLAPEIPSELAPISVEQQTADIARLCSLTGVQRADWPAQPMDQAWTPDRVIVNQFRSTLGTQRLRICEWLQRLGEPAADPGLYVLAVIMSRLDGWRWPLGGGYPKTAPASTTWCRSERGVGRSLVHPQGRSCHPWAYPDAPTVQRGEGGIGYSLGAMKPFPVCTMMERMNLYCGVVIDTLSNATDV